MAQAGGLVVVIAGLGWLMYGLGGWREGQLTLPDAHGSRIEVLGETGGALTLADVTARPEEAWQPWDGHGYLLARHGEVIWARVTLRNPTAEPAQGVLSDTAYFPDRVEAWFRPIPGRPAGSPGEGSGGNGWLSSVSGEAVDGGLKPLWGRTAAFPVIVPTEGGRVLYLRVSDAYVPHFQPRWWPRAEDFHAAQVRDVTTEFLCYGGLVALLFYNAVLWLRLRFPDMGYYVLYAGAGAVFNFVSNGGLAWFGIGVGSPGKELIMTGALALTGVFVVQFSRVFLGTAGLMPRLDRWLRAWRTGLLGVTLGVATMPWWNSPAWLSVAVVALMLTHMLCLGAALAAWRKGAAHARFFVAAFGLLFVGFIPAFLTWWWGDIRAGAAMAMLAGATLEMLMLSFAVADRFAQTQRLLVEETEQRRMIEETYAEELEIEVRERTRELAEANADKDRMLSVIGHDLRSPLTGLMRAADATPGEFARSASRTGRTLLLLIEDLVLWARLRAGTRVLAPHPASAVLAPAVSLHRSLAEHGGIDLVVTVPADLRVQTDLVLAQTLVRNLLANALKFAQRRVELRAEAEAGGVRFTVGNDGSPLPEAVAARFAAGQDEPMTATGGLGLRLCREICLAFGTRLEAASSAEAGTEFHFTLPAAIAGSSKTPFSASA